MYFKLFIFAITIVALSRLADGQVPLASAKVDTDTCLRYCNALNAESVKSEPGNVMECDTQCKEDSLLIVLKKGFVKQCQDKCHVANLGKENPENCVLNCRHATYDPKLGFLEEIEFEPINGVDSNHEEVEACDNI